ncbi:MAG: hypothetical protein J7K49_01425 [Thaumarchaeota archaeon]|nr:hypothetical protein [Nitrososphaerota archaeon]
MGEYDFRLHSRGLSDEVVLALLFSLGRLGRVRIVALKAVPVEEAAKIIEKLP